jgi:hypothetical protein
VERFADIDIAKAGHDGLIEQQQLDRRNAPLQGISQMARRQAGAQRLGAQRGERAPLFQRVGLHQIDRAEPARVVEREGMAMAGFDQQVVVLAQRLGIDPPAPRHAQMEDHRAAPFGVDQAIWPGATGH